MSKAAKAAKIAHVKAVKKLLPFGTIYLYEQATLFHSNEHKNEE